MTDDLAAILEALDIRVIPTTKQREPGETCAINTIENLFKSHGPEHLTIVLRSIAETVNNRMELVAPTIAAVSDVILAHPTWAQTTEWLDEMDKIDLTAMREKAKANRRAVPLRRAMATLLFAKLSEKFAVEKQGALL